MYNFDCFVFFQPHWNFLLVEPRFLHYSFWWLCIFSELIVGLSTVSSVWIICNVFESCYKVKLGVCDPDGYIVNLSSQFCEIILEIEFIFGFIFIIINTLMGKINTYMWKIFILRATLNFCSCYSTCMSHFLMR
jgi:hypothetical protein